MNLEASVTNLGVGQLSQRSAVILHARAAPNIAQYHHCHVLHGRAFVRGRRVRSRAVRALQWAQQGRCSGYERKGSAHVVQVMLLGLLSQLHSLRAGQIIDALGDR